MPYREWEREEEAYVPYYAMDEPTADPSEGGRGGVPPGPSGPSLPWSGGGGRLFRLPERGVLGLLLHMVIPGILLVAFLWMVVSNAGDIDTPMDVLLAIALPLIPALVIVYMYMSRQHIDVYEDRVVINRRAYPREALHYLDGYKFTDYAGYVGFGRRVTPIVEDYFELVFTVVDGGRDVERQVTLRLDDHQVSLAAHQLQELLPNLRVTIHEGVEDRVPTAMKLLYGPGR